MSQNIIIDEKDTSREKTFFFKSQAKTISKNCKGKNINCYETENKETARILISELVAKFKNKKGITKLGYADSVSLHQIEIFKEIEKISDLNINNPLKRWPDGKYEVFGSQPPGKLNLPKDEYYGLMGKLWDKMRESLLTDIYITGANALSIEGQIVSIDGTGNRVSAMAFGPSKIIIVVGRNKITKDLQSAINRIFDIAAPLTYLRHNEKHHNRHFNPCMNEGWCPDCRSDRRGCLNLVIINGAMEINKNRIHLVLINEDLGY